MNRKFHLFLDILMTVMMLTLYSKRFISMQYHEIAGIVLIIVVLTHIIINAKTAWAMCKKFLKVPAAIKVGLIVDVLLMICFVWFGISGIMISHTILTGISSGNMIFKLGHMFAGGLSVILLGIHIGLHICRKPMKTVTAVIISVVVLCGGIYGATNSSVVRWLSIPFTVTTNANNAGHEQQAAIQTTNPENTDKQDLSEQNGQPNGGNKNAGHSREPLSLAEKLQSVIMFLGMMMTFAMGTYWIAVPKKKKTA